MMRPVSSECSRRGCCMCSSTVLPLTGRPLHHNSFSRASHRKLVCAHSHPAEKKNRRRFCSSSSPSFHFDGDLIIQRRAHNGSRSVLSCVSPSFSEESSGQTTLSLLLSSRSISAKSQQPERRRRSEAPCDYVRSDAEECQEVMQKDETKQRGRIAEAIYEDTNGQRNRGGASHEEIERGQEKESATPNVSCSSSSSALPPSCSLRSVSSSMSTPLLHSKGQSHQREQCVDKLIQEQAYLIQLVQQIRSLHQTLLRYSYYYENNGRKTEGRTSSFPSSSSGVCPPSSHSPSVPSSPTPYIHSSGPSASPSHAGLDPSASCPHPCRVSFPSYRHPAPPTSPSGHIMTPSPRLVGESPCQENRFVSSPFLQTIDLQTSSASSSSPVMPFLQTPSLHSHGTASPFLSTSSSWGDGGACSRPSASSASSPLSSRKGNKRSFINRGVSSHLQAGEETRAPPSVHTPGSTTSSRSPPPRRRRAGVGGCLRVSSSFSPVKFCSQTEAHTTVKEVMNTAIREKQGMIGEEETKQEERRGRKGRIPVARSHFEGDSITFESHWSEKGVKDGLEKGMLIIGLLQIAAFQTDRAVVLVNPEHCPDAIRASVPYKEVHLHSPLSPPLLFSKDTRSSTDSDLQSKYFSPQDPSTKTYLQFSLGGFVARNRALHGDLVAVTFFPRFYSEHLLSLRGVLTSPSPSSLSSPTTTTTIPTSSSSCCLSSVSSARSSPPSLSLHNSDSSSSSPCPGSTTSLTPHSFSDTEDACLPSSFSVSKADGTVGQVGRIGQTEGEREEPKSEDPSSRQVLKESSLQTAHGCEEQQHSSRENNTQKTAGDSKEPVKCGKDQQKKLEYLSTGRVVRILARSRDTSRLVCVIPPQYDTLRKFLSSRSLVASTPTSGGMTGVEGYDAAKHGDKHGQEKEEKGRNVGRRKERTMRENHRSTMKSQDNRDVASCSSNVDAGGERGGNGDRYTGNLYLKAQPRDSRLPPFLIPVASLFESLPSDKQFNPGPDAFSLLASHDSRSSDRCSSSLPPPFSSSSSSLPCSSSVSLPSLKDERGSMKSRLHPTPLLRSILTVWAGSQESEKDNSSVPDRYSDATISPSLSPSPASPTSSPFSSPSASSSSCSPSSFSSSSLSSALVVIGRGGWGSRYACPLGVIDETSRCLGGKGEEDILGEALSTLHMQGLIHAEGFPQEILQNLEERLSKSTGSKTSGRKPLWLVEAENDNYRLDCRPHLRIDDSQRGLEMKGDNNTQVECRSRSSRTNLVSNRNLEMSEDVSGGEKEVKIRRKDILCKGEETQRIEEQVERRAEKRSASTQIDSLDERRKTEKKEEQARGYLPDKNEEEQSPSEQHHDRLQPSCLRASSSLEGSPLSSFPSLNISFYASSPPSSLSSSVRPVEYSTSSLRAFTIDPPTAKDLDDAISIVLRKGLSSCPSSASSKNGCEASTYGREDLSDSCYLQALQGSETNREQTDGEKEEKRHKEQTTFEIGVHVADVSHFVQEGSDLDAAAAERATTVYLDAKVFPMLPSPLSEGVCSLLPNEDRLAFSMFMALDENGELLSRPSPLLVKTLIKTECRLDYSQVDAFLGTLRRSLAKAPCLCTSPAPRHLRYSTSSLSIREDRQKSVGDLRKLHSASPEYFSLENPLLWNLLISHAPPFSYSRNPYRSSPTCHPSFIGDKECGRALNSLEKNSHEEDRCRETEIVVKEDEKWLVKNTEEWRQRKSDLSGVLQSTAQDFGIPCEISRDILILHLLTSRRKALRREQGALHLSSAGKLSMYIEPHPVHLKPKRLHIIEENHSLSHALVEECMILANHCVAREILSAGTRALGRQQHARRGGTHGLHEESSRDTRLKERENRQHAEIQEQQWRYTRDDQTSPFSFTERTEGNGLSAKKDEKSKEQSQVVLSSDVSFDVKSKSNDEEEEDRNRSRRSLRMSRKTDDPDGQGRREEDKEEQERKKGREVGSRTLNEEEGRTGGTSENLPLLSPQQESVFGGLLRQHSNSNFEAVKYLRSLMGASLWSEFCREEKNKLVSRTCTDACTEEEQEKQKEEKDEEQREDDQQDLKGVLLGHVLEFCSSRMDAPVYNALCFSVLQEYFSQAQYVSPMMSLKSASPSSSEQPSSLSSKEKRVRTDRREEPSSSSATTTTSLYLSRNVAHESDAASGKGGIVEMAQDEKDYGTKATQHSHARDDFLSSFSHPPDQKHHHNGSNAPIPLDSQFSHWALNLSSYMHFTSPIRRYADLHIHRILSKYLRGDDLTVPIDTLQRACKQCNENSRKADEAQMTFRSWYFNAYLRRHQPEGLLYSHATILKIILPSHFSKSKENADDGVEHLQQQPTSQGVPIAATSILHQVETQETVTPLSTPIEGRGTENMDEDQHFNKIDCDKRLGDVLRTKETLHNHGDDDKKENKLKLEERAVDTDGGEEEKTTSKEGKNAAAVNSEKNKAALVIYIPLLQSTRSMSLATLGLEHVDDVDEVCEDTREKKQGWVRQEERENNPKADNKNRGCNEVTSIHVRRLVLPLASSLPSPSHPLVDSTIPTTPSPPSLSYSSSHPPVTVFSSLSSSPAPPSSPSCSCSSSSTSMSAESKSLLQGSFSREVWREEETRKLRVLQRIQVLIVPGESQWTVRLPFWKRVEEETAGEKDDIQDISSDDRTCGRTQ